MHGESDMTQTASIDAILAMAQNDVMALPDLPKPQADDLPRTGWYELRTYPAAGGGTRQYLYYRWRHRYGKARQTRILARNLGRLE